MKRYILVKLGKPKEGFPIVTICDTQQTVPAVINGCETRFYKSITEPMPYLAAYPLMKKLNEVHNLWVK